MTNDSVRAWGETVHIPTYRVGAPDKNPMFLEKRVYQGSSGVVYPYPVIDRVFDDKQDAPYTALFLENRYLKIMILPELGGRVQMALDKTNGYHFVYYNRVIKPALVGLTGPWISGGIEFNWPQHHRPTTFAPVDWRIIASGDGSKTVWCSEIERMFFTKGTHGFTLHPNRAYLQIDVQLYNRTSEPQTFLWWANPAVHVNDDYQSVFPPDVHAVMDHGKRDVSAFPIACGRYYKVNYAPGTDISRYKNIPVPTSFMAYHSDFDFVGDYDHGKQAGMMHVANHHVVPGKKQWTWGKGDFGWAWDRNLTDDDGPYIELMCGAFTDNQPDFSWLMPGEEKRFTQFFMPYKAIGGATNASKDAVVNLEIRAGVVQYGVYVTQPRQVRIVLLGGGSALADVTVTLDPHTPFTSTYALPAGLTPSDVGLRVMDAASERELTAFTLQADDASLIPAPATPVKPPGEITSNEELFLSGLHLEQYRHATYAPEPYYEEALRRDPSDSRCNNALGLLLYRRGKFAEAEPYFHKAIASLTRRNPNPYDGEPYYNLGLSLKMQGRILDAYDAFYKATWNAAWQDAALFELARLAACRGQFDEALDLTVQCLRRNWSHHKARHLKAMLLHRAGRDDEALAETDIALGLDPMDYGALHARQLIRGDTAFDTIATYTVNTRIELALDCIHANLSREAIALLATAPQDNPLVHYFAGFAYWRAGDVANAHVACRAASAAPPDYCFPHQLESVLALQLAMVFINPQDARAPYYLGNFWYAHRRYDEAIDCWEKACALDPSFATPLRNLGLAYFNKRHDPAKALQAYQRAFALNADDARVLFELDQLRKMLNMPPAERLSLLQQHLPLVDRRDDLTLERVTLRNVLGQHDEAYAVLMGRTFHPWEGGEGKAPGQYVASLIGQAQTHMAYGRYEAAIDCLTRAQTYPHNLGEGKLYGAQENNIFYYLGLAHRALGDEVSAHTCFERASTGLSEPASAMFYNDQPPDMIFYQGLAGQALGREAEAQRIFQKLIDYGQVHQHDAVLLDYFAVSLPSFLVFDDDLNERNHIHCDYMMALGYLGLGQHERATAHFDAVLQRDANHPGALSHRKLNQASA